jgi:hypothetical protein
MQFPISSRFMSAASVLVTFALVSKSVLRRARSSALLSCQSRVADHADSPFDATGRSKQTYYEVTMFAGPTHWSWADRRPDDKPWSPNRRSHITSSEAMSSLRCSRGLRAT